MTPSSATETDPKTPDFQSLASQILTVRRELEDLTGLMKSACSDVGFLRHYVETRTAKNARERSRRKRLEAEEAEKLHRKAMRQAESYKRLLKTSGVQGARSLIEERPESVAERSLVRKAVTAGMTADELWLTEAFRGLTDQPRLFEVLKIWALEKNSKFPHRLISEREMIRRFRNINSNLIARMKRTAERINAPEYRRLLAKHTARAPRHDTLASLDLMNGAL